MRTGVRYRSAVFDLARGRMRSVSWRATASSTRVASSSRGRSTGATAEYESIFGSTPPLDDAARFPRARPSCRHLSRGEIGCRGVPGDGADHDSMGMLAKAARSSRASSVSASPSRPDTFVTRAAIDRPVPSARALLHARAIAACAGVRVRSGRGHGTRTVDRAHPARRVRAHPPLTAWDVSDARDGVVMNVLHRVWMVGLSVAVATGCATDADCPDAGEIDARASSMRGTSMQGTSTRA